MNKSTAARRSVAVAAALIVGSILSATVALAQQFTEATITAEGIGDAVIGSTVGELEGQMGDDWSFIEADNVLVDLSGFAVREFGETRFYALGGSGSDRLSLFLVTEPGVTTAEGIGVGSTLAEAVTVYGEATLGYSTDNEGREFASFANGPEGRVNFRTGSAGDTAGIYADSNASGFVETTDFDEAAQIEQVWVSCVVDLDCPVVSSGRLPDTGSGQGMSGLVVLAGALMVAGALFAMTSRRLI